MNAILSLPRTYLNGSDLPDGFELAHGRLVENQMGTEANWIAGQLAALLNAFCRAGNLGWVIAEATYRCFPDSMRSIRRPDVSFVRNGRFPNNRPPKGDCLIVPDLVVEVISPNDNANDLEEKIDDYLTVQVPLIWIIHPHTRTAYSYRSDGAIRRIRDSQSLDGDGILPGFSCPLVSILPEPIVENHPETPTP